MNIHTILCAKMCAKFVPDCVGKIGKKRLFKYKKQL